MNISITRSTARRRRGTRNGKYAAPKHRPSTRKTVVVSVSTTLLAVLTVAMACTPDEATPATPDIITITSDTPSVDITPPTQLNVSGTTLAECDDMGGAFDNGLCIDVDY